MQAQIESTEDASAQSSRKFLTFQLGEEDYGLDILNVQEIIGLLDITLVPMCPDYVRGVINLRGKIIPVVDLRQRFGMGKSEDHARKCIIVMDFKRDDGGRIPISLLVDQVSEVLDIAQSDIELSATLGGAIEADYICGVAKVKDEIKILLNLDAIISEDFVHPMGGVFESNEEDA